MRLRRPLQPLAPCPPRGQGQRGQCGQRGQRDGASRGNAVRVAQSAGRGPKAPQGRREPSGTRPPRPHRREGGSPAGRGPRGPTEEAGAPWDGDAEAPWREEAVAPQRPCCRPAGAGTRSRAEPGLRSRVSDGDVRVGPVVWLSRGRLQQGVRGPPQGPERRVHGGLTVHSAEWVALGSGFGKSKGRPLLQGHGAGPAPGGLRVFPEKERGSLRGGIRKL